MSTTLKPRTATVTIYQGDDMEKMVDLRRRAAHARARADAAKDAAGAPLRMGDEAPSEAEDEAKATEAEFDAFVDGAAERALSIQIQSIGRKRFRDLMVENPPRKVKVKVPGPANEDGTPGAQVEEEQDNPDDWMGIDSEKFPVKLLTFIDVDDPSIRTIASPEFAGRKAVEDFLDNELPDGDFDKLWIAAFELNTARSIDPKEIDRFSSAPRSSTAT